VVVRPRQAEGLGEVRLAEVYPSDEGGLPLGGGASG
jgi:hypothetical protein